MPRPKVVTVEKIVYKDRAPWLTLENMSMVKQWVATIGPVALAAYLWVIPQIQAQTQNYLKNQLDALGISADNIAGLNKNLEEMQKKDDERSKDIEAIKDGLGKLIYQLEQQKLQQVPVYPPTQQAAPPPVPLPPPPAQ